MTEHIAASLCELIGGTPLVRLARFGKDLPGEIVGKLELRNPLASVKDRIGLAMEKDLAGFDLTRLPAEVGRQVRTLTTRQPRCSAFPLQQPKRY